MEGTAMSDNLPQIPLDRISALCRWMVDSGMYSDYDVASCAAYPDREKSRLAYAAWRKDVESDIRNDC
jgi:hypothetical protein